MTTETEQPYITVVSGPPRTGTSMMMRMLAAGGMEIITDGERRADEDNPHGYYEYERVKQLKRDASWLDEAHGKAIKVIYRLLYDLPDIYRYKVIFMKRSLVEVIASQKVMLKRQQRDGAKLEDRQLIQAFQNEIGKVERWVQLRDNLDFLPIDFNSTVSDPENAVAEIERFLGRDLDVRRMVGVVDPALYRQRAKDTHN